MFSHSLIFLKSNPWSRNRLHVYTKSLLIEENQTKGARYPVVYSRALISGSASVARSATSDARCVGPEAKIMRYVREYAPENQLTNCVETPPEPRKGVYKDALGCLGEKTS